MPPARVVSVAPRSPAAGAGVLPGDEIVAVNGEALHDVIAYRLQADEARVELDVRRGGLERSIVVTKAAGRPLGLELDGAVFDAVQTCDNHCPFCFIHQLPRGMRRSLSLRDDDYRLSFLYGNFTTLTRFTEWDLERVVTERLSPLHVSIHATDPEVRTRLLRNRRGATSLRWLGALLDAGIEVHGQVVVCPGVNDGAVLDDTLLGVFDRFPALATLGVVPLGVSAHQREPDMRAHTPAEAKAVVETVERWQARYGDALGRRLVYASDEYYLLAGRDFPAAADYDGFPQHENGVGMARAFEADVRATLAGGEVVGSGPREGFFAWVEGRDPAVAAAGAAAGGAWRDVDGAPPDGYRAPRVTRASRRSVAGPTVVLTGELGAPVLESLRPELEAAAGAPIDIRAVPNRFFGGNIGVTGLLTGADVAAALAEVPEDRRVLLPDVVLSRDVFLDDLALTDLPRPVEVVATDGAALVRALA